MPASKWTVYQDNPITGLLGGCAMHSNPIPTERPTPRIITRQPPDNDITDIYFPTLDQIVHDMHVRAFWRAQRSWGERVDEIDTKTRRVLVRNYIGGTRERAEWIPIERIYMVWNPREA
jgi:hypothetical protein